MNSIILFFALLWRTLVTYLALGLLVLAVIALLRTFGMNLLPPEVATTAGFIKLKPTLMYAAFAVVLLSAEVGFRINLVRLVGGARLRLSAASWRWYAFGLSALSIVMAALNALVAATASVNTWINYKFFGASCLLLVGIFFLASHIARTPKSDP